MPKKKKHPHYIKKEFADVVEDNFDKCHIIKYYPWTDVKMYPVLSDKEDLTKVAKNYPHVYKNKSADQLILEIHQEINRALYYLMVLNMDIQDWFHHQRLNALCYATMMSSGYGYYKKSCTKNEIDEQARIMRETDIKDKERSQKKFEEFGISHFGLGPQPLKYYRKHIEEYGYYVPIIKPLLDKDGNMNYTIQELRAIHFMIALGEFENLC